MQVTEYSLAVKKIKTPLEKIRITTSKQASDFARQFYFDDMLIYESFFIMLIDRRNGIKGYAKISQGGIAGTIVDIKIIAKYCIDVLASACIVVHNHPSGITEFSKEDITLSKKLSEALKLIDVVLMDSIVLTEKDYSSMKDDGIL